MWNFQTNYCLKLDSEKVNSYTGDQLLIHGTKHCTDNQFQSMSL